METYVLVITNFIEGINNKVHVIEGMRKFVHIFPSDTLNKLRSKSPNVLPIFV